MRRYKCMATSQNGYTVIFDQTDPRLKLWKVPGTNRTLRLRADACGYVLAFVALWFHEVVEPINVGTWDEWAWAVRPVRGQVSGYSNHASGTAIDLNATEHPRGVTGTFTTTEKTLVNKALQGLFRSVIRWGETYQNSPVDGMHFEINAPLTAVKVLASVLRLTARGKRLTAANA